MTHNAANGKIYLPAAVALTIEYFRVFADTSIHIFLHARDLSPTDFEFRQLNSFYPTLVPHATRAAVLK